MPKKYTVDLEDINRLKSDRECSISLGDFHEEVIVPAQWIFKMENGSEKLTKIEKSEINVVVGEDDLSGLFVGTTFYTSRIPGTFEATAVTAFDASYDLPAGYKVTLSGPYNDCDFYFLTDGADTNSWVA